MDVGEESQLALLLNAELRKRHIHTIQRFDIRTTSGGVERPPGTPMVRSPNMGVCVAIGAGAKSPYDVRGASGVFYTQTPEGVVGENYRIGDKMSGRESDLRHSVAVASRKFLSWYREQNASQLEMEF